MRTDAAPGVPLRLTALVAVAGVLLAVVSGTLGGGAPHRVLSALVLPPLLAIALGALLAHRRLVAPSLVALALLLAAALVTAHAPHVVLAALTLAATAALAAATWRGAEVAAGRVRDYVTLTKPRIMSLLLLTGACGMVVGARGDPGPGRLLLMLLGLALACGGASALNHVLDRDIDRLMGPRTAGRPVAGGRMSAPRALEFGLALSACSFVLLAATVNVLTAVLALVGNLFYVVVYTGYLKRRGPSNIVLGGAAGAVPPLVGYAAATGSLALPAAWLFLIVFLWTPPHFWSLALLLREHYGAARVPMLPVVRGDRATLQRIVGYTIVLVAVSALPVAAGSFGLVYLAGALVLGGAFLSLTLWLRRAADRRRAAFVFHASLLYLALIFVAAALDAAV
ncbi:MAG TPA: heme o synthase [Gaiellaceae bacterium]